MIPKDAFLPDGPIKMPEPLEVREFDLGKFGKIKMVIDPAMPPGVVGVIGKTGMHYFVVDVEDGNEGRKRA